MKISIIGISQLTDFVLDNIINHSDEINIYSDRRNFDFENKNLVIEIDGERYHKNWNGELCKKDQLRNQRLFELGYDVIRFWVYQVRDDLENCFKILENWKDQNKS